MSQPKTFDDLPYAPHLEHHDTGLEADGDYHLKHLRDQQLVDPDADGAYLSESAFSNITVEHGSLRRLRLNDVWANRLSILGTDLSRPRWHDTHLVNSAAAGVVMAGGDLSHVVFHGCKLASVNLRGTTLRHVTFVDTILRDVDFGEAELVAVSFPGSALHDVTFRKARMTDVDLRDAVSLAIRDGYESLRAATISLAQAHDLAPGFAHALGVIVDG